MSCPILYVVLSYTKVGEEIEIEGVYLLFELAQAAAYIIKQKRPSRVVANQQWMGSDFICQDVLE